MKIGLGLLALVLAVATGGCRPGRTPVAAAVEAVPAAATGPDGAAAVADTALPFAALPIGPVGNSLQLEGQLYRVETSARIDEHHQLLMRDSLAGQLAAPELARLRAVGAGYEATYTLRLRRPDGQEQFTTTLRKTDFVAALGQELVTESLPAAPVFGGYLSRFDALAFTVRFQAYDTDWAASALLLLDARSGAVRYLGLQQRAQDEPARAELTPDGRTLLTRYAILSVHRPPVELALPHLTVAGTRLVNARTALVVYDYALDERGLPLPLPRANALLLDLVDGRLLTRLHLGAAATGYQDGRGLHHQYLAQTRTHYFLSPDDQSLLLVPRDRPTAYRRLRLSAVPRFSLAPYPREVRFHLGNGLGPQTVLYADTLTGALRCQLLSAGGAEARLR